MIIQCRLKQKQQHTIQVSSQFHAEIICVLTVLVDNIGSPLTTRKIATAISICNCSWQRDLFKDLIES